MIPVSEIPRTGKVLLLSTDPARRARAARALGECGHITAYAWLRRGLWDENESVRISVVEAVGSLAAQQAMGELGALFAWSSPPVRRAVVRAACRIAAGEGRVGLLALAAVDPDPQVRLLAACAGTGPAVYRAENGRAGLRDGRAVLVPGS
jgi:HEAT repeat protein